jgi:hypothetical protein
MSSRIPLAQKATEGARRRRGCLWGRLTVLVLTAAALAACGGSGAGSPTAPPSSAPSLSAGTVLKFVSGETNQPVRGAIISSGGERYTTSASGEIALRASMPVGAAIDISAQEALDRLTLVHADLETRFTLWPKTSSNGLDPDFTNQVVYMNFGPGGLIRPRLGTIMIVPSQEITSDPQAMQSHIDAAAAITRASDGQIRFVVDPLASSGVIVKSTIDAASPIAATGAGTLRQYEGNVIVAGSLIFRGLNNARCMGVVLHELGHIYGLGHSLDSTKDLMGPGPCNKVDFSDREKLSMTLMLQRRPGNLFPDNDRGAGTASHILPVAIRCAL